jgi:hypothetical protein
MRSKDTTISPLPATAPPDNPVRPPDGTSAIPWALASRTRRTTSSTLSGNTTALGSTGKLRVQSQPQVASVSASRRSWRGEKSSSSTWVIFALAFRCAASISARPNPDPTSVRQTSFDRDKIRILLLEGVHPSAIDHLRQAGYDNVTALGHALQGDHLAAALDDVHMLGIRSRTQLDATAIAAARRLIGVGCFCIGTNQVDLAAAQEHGVPVFNAPFSNTRSVAELVLAEIIFLLRGIPQRSAVAHRGGWVKTATGSHEARGKCLGIVGYGHIGTQVGVLAEALGMRVVYLRHRNQADVG